MGIPGLGRSAMNTLTTTTTAAAAVSVQVTSRERRRRQRAFASSDVSSSGGIGGVALLPSVPSSIAATSSRSSRDNSAGMPASSATASRHDGQLLRCASYSWRSVEDREPST